MLRRAEGVTLNHRPSIWTGAGPVEMTVGRKTYVVGKLTKEQFLQGETLQWQYPVLIARIAERIYWKFENKFYWENDGLTVEQVHALLVTKEQRKRQHIERAQATVAMGSAPRGAAVRRAIPDDLKQYVWMRDEGRCRGCGSTTELQYDHIIPLAMGGSSNAENLQILCGPCNRSKSAGLTVRR